MEWMPSRQLVLHNEQVDSPNCIKRDLKHICMQRVVFLLQPNYLI